MHAGLCACGCGVNVGHLSNLYKAVPIISHLANYIHYIDILYMCAFVTPKCRPACFTWPHQNLGSPLQRHLTLVNLHMDVA